MDDKSSPGKNKLVITAISAFVLGFALSWVLVGRVKMEQSVGEADKQNEQASVSNPLVLAGENAVAVDTQPPAQSVRVSLVVLGKDGWVAIHENDSGQARKTAFGAQWLPSGTHRDTTVELLRPTVEGKSYFAVIHDDNGDKKYSSNDDIPRKDSLGNAIMMEFRVNK